MPKFLSILDNIFSLEVLLIVRFQLQADFNVIFRGSLADSTLIVPLISPFFVCPFLLRETSSQSMGTFDPIAQFPNPSLVVSKKKLIGDGPGHRGHSMNPSMDNSEKYDEPDLLNSKLEGCV